MKTLKAALLLALGITSSTAFAGSISGNVSGIKTCDDPNNYGYAFITITDSQNNNDETIMLTLHNAVNHTINSRRAGFALLLSAYMNEKTVTIDYNSDTATRCGISYDKVMTSAQLGTIL